MHTFEEKISNTCPHGDWLRVRYVAILPAGYLEIDVDGCCALCLRLAWMKKSQDRNMKYDVDRLCNRNIVRVYSSHAFQHALRTQIRLIDKLSGIDHSSPHQSRPRVLNRSITRSLEVPRSNDLKFWIYWNADLNSHLRQNLATQLHMRPMSEFIEFEINLIEIDISASAKFTHSNEAIKFFKILSPRTCIRRDWILAWKHMLRWMLSRVSLVGVFSFSWRISITIRAHEWYAIRSSSLQAGTSVIIWTGRGTVPPD